MIVLQIIRREGINLWQELLPTLISLSGKGPIQVLTMFPNLRHLFLLGLTVSLCTDNFFNVLQLWIRLSWFQ